MTSAHRHIAQNSLFSRVEWRSEVVWVSLCPYCFCLFLCQGVVISSAKRSIAGARQCTTMQAFGIFFFFSKTFMLTRTKCSRKRLNKIKSLNLWISTMSLNKKGVHWTDFFFKNHCRQLETTMLSNSWILLKNQFETTLSVALSKEGISFAIVLSAYIYMYWT